MVVAQPNRITRTTLLAMKEVLTPTNSANSTVITMELFFFSIVIIELADIAEVLSHVDTTVGANFGYLNKNNIETKTKKQNFTSRAIQIPV